MQSGVAFGTRGVESFEGQGGVGYSEVLGAFGLRWWCAGKIEVREATFKRSRAKGGTSRAQETADEVAENRSWRPSRQCEV